MEDSLPLFLLKEVMTYESVISLHECYVDKILLFIKLKGGQKYV